MNLFLDKNNLATHDFYFIHNTCVGRTFNFVVMNSANVRAFNNLYQTVIPTNDGIRYSQYHSSLDSTDGNLYGDKLNGGLCNGNHTALTLSEMQALGGEDSGIPTARYLVNPQFVHLADYPYDNLGVKSNSPARDAGVDVQGLVEMWGLDWKDINGVQRDSSPTIGAYEFTNGNGSTFPLSVRILEEKNLVSVPGINPDGMDVNTWWSGRDMFTNVYKFDGQFMVTTTTTPGEGYWMKHIGTNIYNTGDEWPIGGIEIVPNDPISGEAGWNLIGGYENIVSTSDISTTPAGLIYSPVFEYTDGYRVATFLIPGHGYWLKLSGDGQINIPPEPLVIMNKVTPEYFKDDWGKIIITDNTEKSYILYSVKGEVDLNIYELPPIPPPGNFDIRFSFRFHK
jgi:hypothetical protein